MSRGGYRVGGGRPKGIVETRPRRRKKPAGDSDQAKIRQTLSVGIKAKAKLYQEFLRRIGRNENLTLTEKKLMLKLGDELAAEIGEKPPESVETGEKLKPLAFMLRVMNDATEPRDRRDRMAIAAAPYVHPRKGEVGTGKKEDKMDRARTAGAGKFRASPSPSIKLVKKPK